MFAALGYLILAVLALVFSIGFSVATAIVFLLVYVFKVIRQNIILILIGSYKLNFYTNKGNRICKRMKKLQSRFKTLDTKKQKPRIVKKKGKIIKKLKCKTERFYCLKFKMEKEMRNKKSNSNNNMVEVDNKSNSLLPQLESSQLVRPSKFAFVNRHRADVFISAAATIKAARGVIEESIQLEIAYRNLKELDNHLEFEAEKREIEKEKVKLEKEKLKLETEQIKYSTKMLKKRKEYNHREDFDDVL